MIIYFYSIFVLSITVHLSASQDVPNEYAEAVRNGMFNFGVKLNNIIQSNNPKYKNLAFSPTSVYLGLALLHYGSDGATRDELGSLLGIPRSYSLFKIHETIQGVLKSVQTHRLIKSLLPDLTIGKAVITRFYFNEGIFAQNGLKLKRSYVMNTKPLYGTDVITVDFEKNGDETADIINTYIAKHTENRGANLYDALVSPPSHTRLIVESCSYFHTVFETRFHRKKTKYELFYMDNGNTSIANMMHRTLEMPYANITSLGVQAGEIVFGDDSFSLFLVLHQNRRKSLTDFLKSITPDTIKTIIEETANRTEYVEMFVPRFNITFSGILTDQLKNLGINEMFTDMGNFRNMMDGGNSKAEVGHSTYFTVMEHGTESNATKPFKHNPGLVWMEREFFRLNRAFFFFVYHRVTKTVLYYGTVNDPNEDGHIKI